MAKAKKRVLSRAEEDFIMKNFKTMDPKELCEDMPGIGIKMVEAFIETLPEGGPEDETKEDRQERMAKAPPGRTSRLMARDENRRGVAMTKEASEAADDRRAINAPKAEDQGHRIHIMDKSRPTK